MKFSKKLYSFVVQFVLLFLFVPWVAFAGGSEGNLGLRISVDNLTGINRWLINMYNDERLLYAVVVTLVMAGVGVTIAILADVILKILGLEVTKIEHHE